MNVMMYLYLLLQGPTGVNKKAFLCSKQRVSASFLARRYLTTMTGERGHSNGAISGLGHVFPVQIFK